jgi:hypothetical protein
MSKIQERLDALRPYVIGIRYLQGIQVVDAILKEGWAVPDSSLILKERVDGEDNYYMFFSDNEDIDIDDLLNYVQEIINLNIEREKKYELLKETVSELQKIFKDNTLSKLQRLKFSFSEPDIIPQLIDMDKISVDSVNDLIEKTTEVDTKSEVDTNVEPETKVEVETKAGNKKYDTTKSHKNKMVKNAQMHSDIELPPKGQKIELEEFIQSSNIICKCGPEEICPICEEEKDLTY